VGPITLFDKSFLQSLSLDESVWFDNFFLTNIPPIFFVETLADLEKAVRSGRTPEQEVGIIADKTPELNSSPNMFHTKLCAGDLLGYKVTMDGRIIRSGGKPVRTEKQSGVVYEVAPEEEAFNRWLKGDFLEVERQFAKSWRYTLTSVNYEQIVQKLNRMGFNPKNCNTLEEAKTIAESIINASGCSLDRIQFVFTALNIPESLFLIVYNRWGLNGCPPLKSFAPYAAYVLTIEVFFYIAAAANLISHKKVNDKVDLTYLFYLPFCMVFVSSDNIHRRCAPLFMRDDQVFVWGPDLKEDLKRIDDYFDRLPESEKEKGLYAIANRPPPDENFLVATLWDRFQPGWRLIPANSLPQKGSEASDKIIKHITRFTDVKPLQLDQIDFNLQNPDAIVIKRKVRLRKGKWWQLPKNIEVKDDF